MHNFNRETLIENINIQIKNSDMTQQEFGDKIGMSQSNVSKALNFDEKKFFTIEQLVDIAVLFNISLDELLGIKEKTQKHLSPRFVAEVLTQLIENEDIKLKSIEIEEEVYEEVEHHNIFDGHPLTSYEPFPHKNSYNAFYMPSYWQVPLESANHNDEQIQDLISEAQTMGNSTRMLVVNDYLSNFINIYNLYKKGSLDEKTYKSVIEGLLSKLPE